jgi:hypothetical protein
VLIDYLSHATVGITLGLEEDGIICPQGYGDELIFFDDLKEEIRLYTSFEVGCVVFGTHA